MNFNNPELIIAMASLLTAGVALLRIFYMNRKEKSDETVNMVNSYSKLTADQQEQIRELKNDNASLQQRLTNLEIQVRTLQLELYQANERITALQTENRILQESLDAT